MERVWIGIVIGWAIVAGPISSAELDHSNLRLASEYESPLRWENVEGDPYCVGGVLPQFDRKHRMHFVTLQPNSFVQLRLPPLSMLRLSAASADEHPLRNVQVWTSGDDRLFIRQNPSVDDDGHNLLVSTNLSRCASVRIAQPESADCSLRVALFVSRHGDVPLAAPYRRKIHVCRDEHTVCTSGQPDGEAYFFLSPSEPREFHVDGPCRIACETRLRFPHGESASRQAYRIRVDCDDSLLKYMEYHTVATRRQGVTLDGKPLNLSLPCTAYFDCPEGRHRIRLSPNQAVFARVLQQECPQHLLGINDSYAPNSPRPIGPLDRLASFWDVTDDQIRSWRNRLGFASAQEQIALRIANDNNRAGGGLSAWWMMHRAATRQPQQPYLQAVADKLKGRHTFYRSLTPVQTEHAHEFFWFHVRQNPAKFATEPDADETNQIVVGRQHLNDAIKTMASGSFFPAVSPGAAEPLVYSLPETHCDTQLRVSVVDDSKKCGRLFVQYDQGPPMELQISDSPKSSYPSRVTRSEAAISGHWHQHRKLGHGSLGGPFTVGRTPAETITVATSELYLPKHVQTVRVWSNAITVPNAPRVTLHVRASKYRRLTESEFLANLKQIQLDDSEIAFRLVADLDTTATDSYDWREIWNHWRPIARLLESHRTIFENGIEPLSSRDSAQNVKPQDDSYQTLEEARQLFAAGEWLPSIEAWGTVLKNSTGETRREALTSRATALVEIGEHFLAERQMRSLVIFEEDLSLRSAANHWLMEYYRRSNDDVAMERLAAVAFLRAPSEESLADLAEALLKNGRHEYALAASLLANQSTASARITTMRSAARLGWWQTYNRLLRTVEDLEEREFWRGIRCVYHGAYESAVQHFESAGEKGAPYHRRLVEALKIASEISDPSVNARNDALASWQDWNYTHPGPYIWMEDRSIIERFDSSNAVYSINLDAYSQYFRATPDAPIQIKVCGPIRLKIEARPVYPPDWSLSHAEDSWLSVSLDGNAEAIPITANYPSSTIELVGTNERPGQRTEHVVDVPAGIHFIELHSDDHDLLARSFLERPEHPITALPPLSVQAQARILAGTFGAMLAKPIGSLQMLPDSPNGDVEVLPVVRHFDASSIGLEADFSSQFTVPIEHPPTSEPATAAPSPKQLDFQSNPAPSTAKRRRLRPPGPPVLEPEKVSWVNTRDISADYPNSPPLEFPLGRVADRRQRSDSNVQRASHSRPPLRDRRLPPVRPNGAPEIRLLSHTEPAEQAELPSPVNDSAPDQHELGSEAMPSRTPQTPENAQRKLRNLLRQAELRDGDRLDLQIQGAALRDAYPAGSTIGELYDRLMRGTTWRRFTQFSKSAGVRIVSVPAWSPETSSVRARSALLPSVGDDERLLSGDDRLVVEVENLEADTVEITLSLATIEYLRSRAIDVEISHNGETVKTIRLDKQSQNSKTTLEIPAGRHSISIGATTRIANHFIRVGLRTLQGSVSQLSHRERYYHVSTSHQPLQLDIRGPARLRIDELQDGVTRSRFVTVANEARRVTLVPSNNEQEGLFRVFELVSDPDAKKATSTYEPTTPQLVNRNALPSPPSVNVIEQPEGPIDRRSIAIVTPEIATPTVTFEDLFPLGGQEDATWALTPGWYSRRPVEESRNLRRPDEFAEFLLTRRFRPYGTNGFHRSQFLLRERASAGSTFGIRHAIERPLEVQPCRDKCNGDAYLFLQASGFAQDTDASADPGTHTAEFSAALRGQLGRREKWTDKWSHTQSATAFGRWLTMDQSVYRPGDIDQDVFTPYKSDHLAGFTLTDSVWYRPYLDTRLWVRSFANSNEDFNPSDMEAIGIRTGWDQAVGPVELSLSYRLARFLNDQDRIDAFTQHVISLNAFADYWRRPRERYELGARIQHNLSDSDTSIYVFLAWYFDNGRDYRDFRIGERPFLRFRRLNAARRPNNRIMLLDG